MNLSKRPVALLVLSFLTVLVSIQPIVVSAIVAQREPITPANVSHLIVARRYGQGLIYSAKWTASGNLYVECTSTGLWLYEGSQVKQPPRLLPGSTRCLRFDVNADGTVFVWSSHEPNTALQNDGNIIFLSNTKTEQQRQFSMPTEVDGECHGPCKGGIAGVALSDDGEFLAARDETKQVIIWGIRDARRVTALTLIDPVSRNQPTTSADSAFEIRQIGTALELRDKQTKRILHQIPGFDWTKTAYSPDGRFAVEITMDYGLSVITYTSNGTRRGNLTQHSESVAFSPDSRTVAVGQEDGSIGLFDVLQLRQNGHIQAGNNPILSVAFRPDGKMVAAVSDDLTVSLWDVKTKQLILMRRTGTLPLARVRFSPDERLIAATSQGSLHIWDAESGTQIVNQHIVEYRDYQVWEYRDTRPNLRISCELMFSADGQQVIASNGDENVEVWDVQTGKLQARKTVIPGNIAYFAVDGTLFTASDKRIRQFDLTHRSSAEPLQVLDPRFEMPIWYLTGSGDSSTLGVMGDWMVQLWQVKTGTLKNQIQLSQGKYPSNFALNTDGSLLAIARPEDGGIDIWDTRTGKQIVLWKPQAHTNDFGLSSRNNTGDYFPIPLTFSPDGQLLVVGSNVTGTLYFLDVITGALLLTRTQHLNAVRDVQFNRDGTQLISAGLDGAVVVLEIVQSDPF